PEPHALWRPTLPHREWDKAHIRFERDATGEGQWVGGALPKEWTLRYKALHFACRLTPFRHTGVFPEQAVNWDWCGERIRRRGGDVRVLNLFGYTGIATLAAAAAGAKVTHVDASRPAMTWARENQALSGMESAPIRWL